MKAVPHLLMNLGKVNVVLPWALQTVQLRKIISISRCIKHHHSNQLYPEIQIPYCLNINWETYSYLGEGIVYVMCVCEQVHTILYS